ncbi:MAG: LamG domain-containing protein, partial [Gammaproteobacteria bacterium]
MLKNRSLIKTIGILALGAVLSACDTGSVGTSSNPDTSIAASGFFYSGPAARSIDVSNFQYYLWRNVIDDSRCGGCHNSEASSPISPFFFDTSDVNVAYDQSISKVDLANPLNSEFVAKLNSGHFCWESVSSVCGTLIAGWIDDWINASSGGVAARQINLTAPASIRDPGAAKSFPTDPAAFAATVYPLLVGSNPVIANNNCQNCHDETAMPLPQAPFFASGDIAAAYEAAKAKIDIDNPANSRLVQRLLEQHNCWSDCANDAALMEARITQFANGITATAIDPSLVTSMALTLDEGIIASGGNRHETDQFALWEFKIGSGLT